MKIPYERAIFVCTNKREGGRVSCAGENRPGEEICRVMKERVKSLGLGAKVRVIRTGCLDLCESGPAALIYPESKAICGLNTQDAVLIIDSLTNQR